MLLDALRWNMLNIIRVELFFNVYELYDVFINSSFKTLQGQYVVASFVITLLAQTFVQFDWSWLLSFYALYLSVGICCWIYRRVFFYRRKLDWAGVQRRINQFETDRIQANGNHLTGDGATASSATISTTATLKHHSKTNHHGPTASSSASSSSSSTSSSSSSEEHTNSLQRLRSSSYHNFLKTPRQNHREFALSLSHLSHISKLIADHWDKDIYDEMHIQILATRRDVVNIILRCILFLATTFLAYMK